MTGFGGYEAVREINRSGGKSVWTARKAGGKGEPFAIRWFEPSVTLWDDEEIRREIALFLERAQIQKKAAAGGKFWAPIFAHGESDGRAALVTRNYRRTAEELISGKVTISAAGLHRIVRSVVRGLQQLKRTCDRPHGALRASSILIGGKRKLSQATIVLCSPAPAADAAGKDETTDFR